MEFEVKIFAYQRNQGPFCFINYLYQNFKKRILLILKKMFQGGKKRKPPTNFIKLITNLITKLDNYSAIKENYQY